MKKLTIGILAHVDAGKTTLSEAILYTAGELRKLGRVDQRSSFLDTHVIERERGITVFSKPAVFTMDDLQVTLLDTPGHVDFSGEMERALSVLDYAVLLISATDGVQAHTETLWRLLERYHVPTFIFITKMDLPAVTREKLLSELKERFGGSCIDFAGEGKDEEIAVLSEEVLERYFETGTLKKEEIQLLLLERKLFPCFFGSGLKTDGVAELLQAIADYTVAPVYGEDFAARVYKITRDAAGQRLTHLKITGGALRVRTALSYTAQDGTVLTEKITQIRRYSGEKFEAMEEVRAGDVCAVTGLTQSYPGEGLGADKGGNAPVMEPVMSYRLRLPEGVDVRAALPKLKELQEEDPLLHIAWDEHLQEIQLRLMGEVQLEVLRRIILERFDWEVIIDGGRIRYLETIAEPVEGAGHYEPLRHYAEVHLLLEPLPRGSGLVFASAVPLDVLDLNWQRLIMTHLAEKTHRGVLTGAPITDMAITLTAGQAHLKHTEGGDFREATYRAVRQGLRKAKSILLEPFYAFRLTVPMGEIGRAINDLRLRNCTFESPEEAGEDFLALTGRGPVAALRDYAAELAAYSHGRGRFSCTVDGYEPCAEQEKKIAELGYDADRDVENTADSVFCSHGAGHTVPWNEAEQYMHLSTGIRLGGEIIEQSAPKRRNAPGVDEKELEAIMEREFGPISRRQYRSAHEVLAEEREVQRRIKKNYLIIDGYNLLFASEKAESIEKEELHALREALIRRVVNVQGFTGGEVILVFDAYLVKGNPGSTETHGGVHVVYTKEGETCDAYIEKLLAEIGRNEVVRVATSDALIQLATVRQGVRRISSRELLEEFTEAEKQIGETIEKNNAK